MPSWLPPCLDCRSSAAPPGPLDCLLEIFRIDVTESSENILQGGRIFHSYVKFIATASAIRSTTTLGSNTMTWPRLSSIPRSSGCARVIGGELTLGPQTQLFSYPPSFAPFCLDNFDRFQRTKRNHRKEKLPLPVRAFGSFRKMPP